MQVILHGRLATVTGYVNGKTAKVWQGSLMYMVPTCQLVPARVNAASRKSR